MSIENIESIEEKLKEEKTCLKNITSFFKRSQNLKNKIREVDGSPVYSIKNNGGSLKTDNFAYIESFSFETLSAEVLPENFIIKAKTLDNKTRTYHSSNLKKENNRITLDLKIIITEISVHATKDTVEIFKIICIGCTQISIIDIASKYTEIKALFEKIDSIAREEISKVEKAKEELINYDEEIENKEKKLLDLKDEYEAINSHLDHKYQKISSKDKELEDLEKLVQHLKNNERQLNSTCEDLNTKISNKREELRELIENRNILSDEYKDYTKEGGNQISKYSYICIAILACFAILSIFIVRNSFVYLSSEPKDVWAAIALVIQRAPFTIAVGIVAGVLFLFLKTFTKEILDIHKKRLETTKLNIIAKDTTFSSSKDLDLNDEQIFKERIRMKIEILKSHLKNEIGETGLNEYKAALEEEIQDGEENDDENA